MRARRKSRILAMSMLYAMDISRTDSLPEAKKILDIYSRPFLETVSNYAMFLAKGVVKNAESIDAIIFRHTHNWAQQRLGMVERQVMRVALYEFAIKKSVPAVVAIDEAVAIAKIYGTPESGNFVNGILDAVNVEINGLEKPREEAEENPSGNAGAEESAPAQAPAAEEPKKTKKPAPYLVKFAKKAAAEKEAFEQERSIREAQWQAEKAEREAKWQAEKAEKEALRQAERALREAERARYEEESGLTHVNGEVIFRKPVK